MSCLFKARDIAVQQIEASPVAVRLSDTTATNTSAPAASTTANASEVTPSPLPAAVGSNTLLQIQLLSFGSDVLSKVTERLACMGMAGGTAMPTFHSCDASILMRQSMGKVCLLSETIIHCQIRCS